jgi:putative transposase
MGRQRRVKFPGALYHVTSRGNRRATIFVDERDYRLWIALLAESTARFKLVVHMLCLIPNHFHLLVQTTEPNISEAMHHLNGKYARRFNWRHALTGHVLQGRFHAELVKRQEHLLTVLQYIPLNPVCAQLVPNADDWRWSTHLHICGMKRRPVWLNTGFVLDQFHGATEMDRIQAYRAFVNGKLRTPDPAMNRKRPYVDNSSSAVQAPPIAHLESVLPDRDAAVRAAWMSRAYTRDQIARHFGISTRTVSRIVTALIAKQDHRRDE